MTDSDSEEDSTIHYWKLKGGRFYLYNYEREVITRVSYLKVVKAGLKSLFRRSKMARDVTELPH